MVFISSLFILPQSVIACSCIETPSVEDQFESSAAVFSGKVLEIEEGDIGKKVLIEVMESWKGVNQSQIIVNTPGQGPSCGFPFEKGEDYLLYAYSSTALSEDDKDGTLQVNICSRSNVLEEAEEDVLILGGGKTADTLTQADIQSYFSTETSNSQSQSMTFMIMWASIIFIVMMLIGIGIYTYKRSSGS